MKISCVILAAGLSTRFFDNKLLYPVHHQPMIISLLEKVKDLDFYQVCVVTGYLQIEKYASHYGFDVVRNNHPEKGISHSIQLGVLQCRDSDAIMFIVGDQPFLKKETLSKMISCFQNKIVACIYQETLYNPMIFPQKFFKQLLDLHGDKGGKVIALNQDIDTVQIEQIECQDIDTHDDLMKFEKSIQ